MIVDYGLDGLGGMAFCIACLKVFTGSDIQTTSDPEPVTEEILAWRGWKLEHLGLPETARLVSINHPCLWEGPTITADQSPSHGNTNGLYALNSREAVIAQGYMGNVIGQVALSGIVVEGTSGYRAERATIRSLCILSNPLPDVPLIVLADWLGTVYQCEVTWETEPPTEPPAMFTMTLNASAFPGATITQQIQNAINAAAQGGGQIQIQSPIFLPAGSHLRGQP